MVMIANLQYGWTLFVQPINQKHGWGLPAIQVAFSIFVICESWLIPFEGWFVDRFGPRLIAIVGGVLIGLAWIVNAFASSLALLYLGAALGRHRGRLRLGHLHRQRAEMAAQVHPLRERPAAA